MPKTMYIPSLTCPNCDVQAMPWYKKAFLGPGRAVKCNNCTREVSVVRSATVIAGLPVLIALIVGVVLGVENSLQLVLIGAAFAIPAHVLLVPLVMWR